MGAWVAPGELLLRSMAAWVGHLFVNTINTVIFIAIIAGIISSIGMGSFLFVRIMIAIKRHEPHVAWSKWYWIGLSISIIGFPFVVVGGLAPIAVGIVLYSLSIYNLINKAAKDRPAGRPAPEWEPAWPPAPEVTPDGPSDENNG